MSKVLNIKFLNIFKSKNKEKVKYAIKDFKSWEELSLLILKESL